MSRPDPIEYAERLYEAIRDANFSPISFLAFGNAVKDGVPLRRLPRIAAEPFMRIVGEMLDLEEEAAEGDTLFELDLSEPAPVGVRTDAPALSAESPVPVAPEPPSPSSPPSADQAASAEPPPRPEAAVAPADPAAEPSAEASAPAMDGERRRNGGRR